MERGRDQRTASNASVKPASRTASARRYSHVRSVVKDLIDDKITPLEAQHGKPVLRQRSQSQDVPSSQRTSITRGQRADSTGREEAFTPRRTSSSTVMSGVRRGGSATPPRSSPSSARLASCDASFPGLPRPYTPLSTASRSYRGGPTSFCRNISQHESVSRVVENLENAVVPYNHVPRCAQEIPERYKYQPPLPPRNPSAERAKPRWNGTSSRCGTPIARTDSVTRIRRVSSPGRTSSATGFSRPQTPNSVRSLGNSERRRSVLTNSSQNLANSVGGRSPSAKSQKRSLSKPTQVGARSEKKKVEAKKEVISFKPLQGIDRVLLFDTEPPKLIV
ncbi:uncharacterized protein TM35_000081660 [Trypanosoma theileri]|uniref:Uncharacterized protein n=1 Tax=Trypanosoma theileri TaxID=67003 RepID=A0A1X0P0M6_9TRYP|nr:uncharacterized protein TM35_000081660 [Trypanosoma theileri]ORC90368.1 hypothetical protein TM35_000081660 [Trypanosoma theileri]